MADPNLTLQDWLSPVGIGKWLAELGVNDAPVPREHAQTALWFFHRHMPKLSPSMALNFLLAIDLSKRVRVVQLGTSDRLVAFRTGNESPFKLFHARGGATAHRLGVNPLGRAIVRFRVRRVCPALESYATGAIDTWSVPANGQPQTVAPRVGTYGVMVIGGGMQLIVPYAFRFLEVETA